MAGGVAEDDLLTLEQQVCFALSVASREVVGVYRPLLEPLGLTHPQYLVMLTLWQNPGPASVKDLSAQLRLDAPTLSPLLKRLEAAGLIERRRDPANERSLQITLTPQGRELRRRAASVPEGVLDRLGMSLEEARTLRQVLLDVIDRAQPRTP